MKNVLAIIASIFVFSCSSPGVLAPDTKMTWSGEAVYFNDGNILEIKEITSSNVESLSYYEEQYIVSAGDKLNVTVWGFPEIFPILNYTSDNPLNTRTVNTDGSIYFPYVGKLKVDGNTVEEVRTKISVGLAQKFVDPQIDVTVVDFNEGRTVYIVGEVLFPSSVKLGTESYSLMDAIGEAKGLNPQTAETDVYIMRGLDSENPEIFKLNIDTSDKFLLADRFNLSPRDIIYIGPSNLTQWNRIIVQLFPFSSFLNSVDLLTNRSN